MEQSKVLPGLSTDSTCTEACTDQVEQSKVCGGTFDRQALWSKARKGHLDRPETSQKLSFWKQAGSRKLQSLLSTGLCSDQKVGVQLSADDRVEQGFRLFVINRYFVRNPII